MKPSCSANQQSDIQERLQRLTEAIQLMYASTFSQHAKAYVRATPYRTEEEKMAVIVQQVVGRMHGETNNGGTNGRQINQELTNNARFYPDFSGVVRSRNFYPVPPMAPEDGVAAVALGMGREVVEGGKCLTFCPRYPQNLVQFSSVKDILSNSQSEFWALEMNHRQGHISENHNPENRDHRSVDFRNEATRNPRTELREARYALQAAEADGTLQAVASTYNRDNDAVYDGMSRPGTRIVSFAPVLKHEVFPLAPILEQLAKVGEDALGQPVEIEFAVSMPRQEGDLAEFGFLQIRPLVLSREGEELRMGDVESGRSGLPQRDGAGQRPHSESA